MIKLIEAAKKGDVIAIEALSQESNFDPNFRDSDGYTPLMWAAHFGHINAINMLLEKGADVRIQDKNNSTLMHFAAESGSIDLMKMLELRGLNCLIPNKNGFTSLHGAAGMSKNGNAIAWLINKGADINAKSHAGTTPLHMAIIKRNVEMISILIQNGALIDETEFKRQWTPLHYAVSLNNLESVNELMKYNPTLDIKDENDSSPIDLAVQSNYSEIIERLSQVSPSKAPPKIHHEYTKINENDIWRFYIDGFRQKTEEGKKHGRDLFDMDEPGYMNAMLEAHKFLNSTLNNELNPELLIALHKRALTKVKNTNNTNLNDFRNKEDGSGSGSFRLLMNIDSSQNSNLGGNTSSAGIKEFLKDIIANGNSNDFDMVIVEDYGFIRIAVEENLLNKAVEIYKNDGTDLEKAAEMLIETIQKKCVELLSPYSSDIGGKVSKIILEYQNLVKNATSDDSKLESIIKLVGDLERLHPFKDGNCRTLVMLLLNRELILNGFPPTMLENPNRFDFFSTNELKNQIKKGWEYAAQFQIVDLRKGNIPVATISSTVGLFKTLSLDSKSDTTEDKILDLEPEQKKSFLGLT